MTIDAYHDFFVAGASVAGALIGLLFVAVSVSRERLAAEGNGALHRVRASAALTAFTNALTVSLFGLIPGGHLGEVVVVVSVTGLLAVAAIVLSLIRAHAIRLGEVRDVVFVIGLATLFAVQLASGLRVDGTDSRGAMQTLAVLVVVCFLVGVARSWELIGGPTIGLRTELQALGRDVGVRLGSDQRADEETQ